MCELKSCDYKSYKITLKRDEDSLSPRYTQSNNFMFIGQTNKSDCPDEQYQSCGNLMIDVANYVNKQKLYDINEKNDIERATKWVNKHLVYFFIDKHEHSDVNFNITSQNDCPFGMMAIRKSDLKENFGSSRLTKKLMKKIKDKANDELRDYNDYCNDRIYMMKVTRKGKTIAKYLEIHDYEVNQFFDFAKEEIDCLINANQGECV